MLLLAVSAALGAPPDAAGLAWLAGTWSTSGAGPTTEEVWTEPAGGTLFGVNRVLAGDATKFHEFLRIEPRDGVLHYVALPKGAPAETAFALVEHGPSRVVFANPEHDFPQRLTYERTGDALAIEVWGPERSFTVALERRAAPP